jgi:hypothetical protein
LAKVVLPVPGNPTRKRCGGFSIHAFSCETIDSIPTPDPIAVNNGGEEEENEIDED